MTLRDDTLLDALIDAALEAGRITLDVYDQDFEVAFKADESPVTAADSAAEAVILRHLARAAPGIPVVAEEEAAAGRVPVTGSEFFLVDPLDGTKEFVQKRGDFTVNIALIRNGVPVLGVVYAPANSRLFAGTVFDETAFQSVQNARVTQHAPRVPMQVRSAPAKGITAVASRSHRTPDTDAYLAQFTVDQLVSVGSSLKFCLVAAGEADLYPRMGPTMEWDTAAGHAVLLAAGGSVVNLDGSPFRYAKPEFRNPGFIAFGDPTLLAAAKAKP